MVIKSTIPVGYCRSLYVKYAKKLATLGTTSKFRFLFSPEFLRGSKALYDSLYPSRIIVGYPKLIENPEYAEENGAIKKIAGNHMKENAETFRTTPSGRCHQGKHRHLIYGTKGG